jgi:hypothetical protein
LRRDSTPGASSCDLDTRGPCVGGVCEHALRGGDPGAHAVLVKAEAEVCAREVDASRAGQPGDVMLRGEGGAVELRMLEPLCRMALAAARIERDDTARRAGLADASSNT